MNENTFLTMSEENLEKLKESNDQVKQILESIGSISDVTVVVTKYKAIFDD